MNWQKTATVCFSNSNLWRSRTYSSGITLWEKDGKGNGQLGVPDLTERMNPPFNWDYCLEDPWHARNMSPGKKGKPL